MNKRNLANLLLFLITLQFACSDSAKNAANQPREINFDDRLKIVKNQETGKYEAASFDEKNEKDFQNSTKTLPDNSTLSTMFDGAGNKTETRFFDNHPLIKNIILRTSVRGEKQIFVYAQNGDIKNLSENTIAKALTSSANELSAAAGIFEQRKNNKIFAIENNDPTAEVGILQPFPIYDFLPSNKKTENEKSEPVKIKVSKEKIKKTKEESETFVPWIEDDEKRQVKNLQ